MFRTLTILFFLFIFHFDAWSQTHWVVDKGHTNINFTVTHMVVAEVDGSFKEFEGSVESTTDDFSQAKVNFVAKSASISTDNSRRDKHLKSEDFFYSDKYPDIKFDGNIEKESDEYFLVGNFTMRDVTKPVRFSVKLNGIIEGRKGKIAGFKVTGTVNRFDYNLKWDSTMESGGLVVGPDVEIICKVELREQL